MTFVTSAAGMCNSSETLGSLTAEDRILDIGCGIVAGMAIPLTDFVKSGSYEVLTPATR